MLWDGLGFFGTDHTKLGRLRGEKVNFLTPIKSPSSVIIFLLIASLTIYIIVKEGSNLGKQKSQTISLVQSQEFYYDYRDVLTLHSANWFYQDQIWDHIRNHQLRNLKETDPKIRDQLREFPVLPEGIMYDDLTWEQARFVEEYLCNRTSMTYMQENYFDSIGTEAYVDRYTYHFRCELLPIANDKIRVHYWIPVED